MTASEEKKEDNIQFSWGKKRGVGAKKGTQFYESFMYDGMEYFLYDSVCLYKDGVAEPYIGKLVKIWEQPVNKKRIKVLWFFRPSEVHMYLGDNAPVMNELFLASGEGAGLFNVNPLEVLAGKCNVVCTSKDERNRQPSLEEIKMSDFIFSRTFNVGSNLISEQFEDTIAGAEVGYLFNQKEKKFDIVTENKADGIVEHVIKDKSIKVSEDGFEDRASKKMRMSDNAIKSLDDTKTLRPVKSQKFDYDEGKSPPAMARKPEEMSKIKVSKDSTKVDTKLGNMRLSEKQTRLSDVSLKKDAPIPSLDMDRKVHNQPVQVTKRPESDKSKWFADMPWDEKIETADDQDRLVILDNLDPDYSQAEVEDIMYHAFNQNCSVRLIERSTFTNPNHGQALVVFKSSDAADMAVQKLNTEIMMLPNGRPLLATKGITRPPGKKSSALIGLLSIDKFTKLKRIREEMRKAASASHYSQPNTVEYEMAMEWMFLVHRSRHWWEELHEANRREIKEISMNIETK